MMFRHPWLVVLAVLVALGLITWTWWRPGRRTVLPTDYTGAPRGWGWLIPVNLAECIPALLTMVAILLLAGPQRLGEPESKRSLTNIELCLDVSYSMVAPFGAGSRYDAAMASLNTFCSYRKGDAFGLTFFGNNTLNWCPLTQDASAIQCSPPFMRPENCPPWMAGTEIAKALRYCRKVLTDRTDGDRMVVLITDGDSSDLRGDTTDQLISDLTKDNITVFAIIIGQNRVQDEVIQVTQKTGGEAFLAEDPEAMGFIFAKIDQMRQAKMEKTIAEAKDWFAPFCIAGLALMGLQAMTAFGLRYTPW